jgi:hypothetical protein
MDEMTPRERINAAIALQPVDRAPIILNMDVFSARYQGVKLAQVVRDPELSRDVIVKTFDDLGGWDAAYLASGVVGELGFAFLGISCKLPGYHLGEDDLWQLDEKEIMKVEDYDFIQKNGWNAYLAKAFPLLDSPVPPDQFLQRLQALAEQNVKDTLVWESKGVPVFAGMGPNPPFESISFTRSLKETMFDVYRRPEAVLGAMDAYIAEQVPQTIAIFQGVKQATRWGWPTAFVGATRGPFLSPRLFDKFFWPYLKKVVNALLEAGITPLLHFDSNWDAYLDHFLDLPKGQVILEIDSATDIFKAKQILKGHMCLMGDVPPAMLKLGTPEEVTAYCKRLVDEVGEGGGFILSQGCDVPVDAKPENVRAILDVGKNYRVH